MNLEQGLPFWGELTERQRERLRQAAGLRRAARGSQVHRGDDDCVGLLLVRAGQLRGYLLSEEGREITLFRLFPGDLCLFSASCILPGIQFEVFVDAWEDTEFLLIPAGVYGELMETSLPVSHFTGELMAARLSEVVWLMDQILNRSFDLRLAAFLKEECRITGSPLLHITHEQIARHLGTAREVVTRMLRYFQREGLVRLARGEVELMDLERLRKLASPRREP